jgi:hypothetical protein
VVALCLWAVIAGAGFLVGSGAPAAATSRPAPGSGAPASLRSAVTTAGGTWVVLPLGDLHDPSNTFWQLLYAAPGSTRWSVVTPEGVADNGGIVASVSALAVDVGVLPSGLLHFSPLARSSDSGRTWGAAFLPGSLVARPDALAGPPGVGGQALAAVGRSVLRAPADLSSWSRTTSVSALAAASPACGASAIDGVAVTPSDVPVVATDCRRGGRVGIFTDAGGRWAATGSTLAGRLREASTEVLRVEPTGTQTTVLAMAITHGHRSLVALWSASSGRWTQSAVQILPDGATVVSTAVGPTGTVAVLERWAGGVDEAYALTPGGTWTRLPAVPQDSAALAVSAPSSSGGGGGFDAFTVSGTRFGVYTTSGAGSGWVRVQSTRVPLSYGSSS